METKPEAQSTALEVRRDFSGTESQFSIVETAGTAAAAKSKATVEARYLMALRNPRNLDQVRQDLLAECKRPAFAHNKSAIYNKPIGKGVEGLGIRFVEVALRCMRNIMVESELVFEDELKEVHRITVTDLESNLTYPQDIRVGKTVERSKPMDDGSYISVRKNSYGKDVFTVPANDDDLLNKRAALISKAVRMVGLRIIPGDFQDEATALIKKIRQDKAAEDPQGEQKRIADAFGELKVRVSDLESYLGHKLDSCSPAELVQLRGIYGTIKDGEATWASYIEQKTGEDGGADDGKKKDDGKTESGRRKPAAVKKERKLFDENGQVLGEGIAPEVGQTIRIGIVEYRVIELTENNAICKIVPAPGKTTSTQQPATQSAGPEPKINDGQAGQIRGKLTAWEISEPEFCSAFEIAVIEDLPGRLFGEGIRWIGAPMDKPNLDAGK